MSAMVSTVDKPRPASSIRPGSEGRLLTKADRDALPDNGLRHELIDGAIIMTPAPSWGHQSMVVGLLAALRSAIDRDRYAVLTAPADVVLGPNVVEPDLLLVRRSDVLAKNPGNPLLVAEVRSKSTGWIDTGRKRELYEQAGIEHYWLADPLVPSLTLLRLVDGKYQQIKHLEGDQGATIEEPAAVHLVPAVLALG